ncbi:hypothetical protein NP233_g9036 [Leucocoprinus birnbaumii]|uniref:Uncharacterized protein n=1 Tax=Leucocoprinus birnbaumii TaxID=56174 RepID=A0AAD5VPP0_9AGAR|nr:hypothetical protein NP233_g9036 [Leucocoprinus birnbaumii]
MHPQHYSIRHSPSQSYGGAPPYWHGALSRSAAYPGAPRMSNVALALDRLSPLVDHDKPLPDVPFAMKLTRPLKRGDWRVFPSTRGSEHRGRRMTDDGCLSAATTIPVGELWMEIRFAMQSVHAMRIIRPQANGETVAISDVIGAVEEVVSQNMAQLSFSLAGGISADSKSFGRSPDGRLVWRGLNAEEDETGSLKLILEL